MQTLTITDAKKNLGRLLQAAARGEDIGIISGSAIIALRKVEVESTDYAQREYGVSPAELEEVSREADRRFQRLKKSGGLRSITRDDLKEMLEEAAGD